MALHSTLQSMLRESLPEYLRAAEYCTSYVKEASLWGDEQSGGCLGYPAALMLLSIVDTIGSFHRGKDELQIIVDGKRVKIRKDGFQHFYVLNSEYYDQSLDSSSIKRLHDNFRNLLAHNASLAPLHFLVKWPQEPALFPKKDSYPLVNIPPFLEKSKHAVDLFLRRIDELLPNSEQARNIGLKSNHGVT